MVIITIIKMVSGYLLKILLIQQLQHSQNNQQLQQLRRSQNNQQLQASRKNQNQKFLLQLQLNQLNRLQLLAIDLQSQQRQRNQNQNNQQLQVLTCRKTHHLMVLIASLIHSNHLQKRQLNQNLKRLQRQLFQQHQVW